MKLGYERSCKAAAWSLAGRGREPCVTGVVWGVQQKRNSIFLEIVTSHHIYEIGITIQDSGSHTHMRHLRHSPYSLTSSAAVRPLSELISERGARMSTTSKN